MLDLFHLGFPSLVPFVSGLGPLPPYYFKRQKLSLRRNKDHADCNLRQGARHLKGTYKAYFFTYFLFFYIFNIYFLCFLSQNYDFWASPFKTMQNHLEAYSKSQFWIRNVGIGGKHKKTYLCKYIFYDNFNFWSPDNIFLIVLTCSWVFWPKNYTERIWNHLKKQVLKPNCVVMVKNMVNFCRGS